MDSQQHTRDGQVGTEGPIDHSQQSTLGAGIPNLKKHSRSDNCTWVGCQQTSLPDDSVKAHLECHSFDVVARWTRGSKCRWQGCKSQAVFKTPSQIKEHLTNIHTEPLLCDQPGCLYKKPFRNMTDLSRHKSTKHYAEPKWECPYPSCSSEPRIFVRKDKLFKHLQDTYHENDGYCPLPHCILKEIQHNGMPRTHKNICEHTAEYHAGKNVDGYGCSLGSCGKTGYLDRWSLYGLDMHLICQHKIFSFDQRKLKELLELADHVFTLEQLSSRPDLHEKWVDCDICASQLQTTVRPHSTN
jgi:hypothetical protein